MEILDDVTRDTPIQRYMDLSKFIDFLENKYLFMSRIDEFEDKLEGSTTQLEDFIYNGSAALLSNLVNKALPSSMSADHSFENVEESVEKREDLENNSKIDLFTTVFGNIPLLDGMNHKDVINDQKKWLDVSCWHIDSDSTESIAMWKIYGGSTNSICITTTVGQLLDSIDEESIELIVSKVHYIDYMNGYSEINHPIAPFINKHKAYRYENELRFIRYDSKINPSKDRNEKGSVIKLKSLDFINKVEVSPEAPKWFFDLIITLFNNRYGYSAKVSRSDLDEIMTQLGI